MKPQTKLHRRKTQKSHKPPLLSRSHLLTLLSILSFIIVFSVLAFAYNHPQTNKEIAAGIVPASNTSFVTRAGSTLLLNGKPFRFAGANIHWLGMIATPAYPPTARIDDVFNVAAQMHATVVRGYTLGTSAGCSLCIEPSLNQFNNTAFTSIDYAIKAAGTHGIRLIIPLTDWNPGAPDGWIGTFTSWRGISDPNQFYTNTTVIQDYKNYVAHILNHVNTLTGIAYKDDPTIMIWENGNELKDPAGVQNAWTGNIAGYIKSLAPKQLVEDSFYGTYAQDLVTSQLQISAVDIYTVHYYHSTFATYIQRLKTSGLLAKQYNKPVYVGEFDWTSPNGTAAELQNFLTTIEDPANNIIGDTYYDLTNNGQPDGPWTMHWPGDNSDMQARAQLIAAHALKMNSTAGGIPVISSATGLPSPTGSGSNPTPTMDPCGTPTDTPTPTVTSGSGAVCQSLGGSCQTAGSCTTGTTDQGQQDCSSDGSQTCCVAASTGGPTPTSVQTSGSPQPSTNPKPTGGGGGKCKSGNPDTFHQGMQDLFAQNTAKQTNDCKDNDDKKQKKDNDKKQTTQQHHHICDADDPNQAACKKRNAAQIVADTISNFFSDIFANISSLFGAKPYITPCISPSQPSDTPSPTPPPSSVTPPSPTGPTSTSSNHFSTLPPGSVLPSESECTARVRRNPNFEPRPDNHVANMTVPTAQQVATVGLGITGNFTGTTDEILQWVSCKWGIDEDIVKAEAIVESNWHQNQLGDQTTDHTLCPPGSEYPGAWNGTSCYQSYGILQTKYIYSQSSWPMSKDNTAFQAEHTYLINRECFEGKTTKFQSSPTYKAGDIWGCLGGYFSGNWNDSGALQYIGLVKTEYNNKTWLKPGF